MAKVLKRNNLLILSFFTIFVGLILKVQIIKASAIECGTTEDLVTERIMGGLPTVRGEWPFLAALFLVEESKFFCGGSLISNKHVMTAAHCVRQKGAQDTLLPADIVVLLGAYDLTAIIERHRQQRNVNEIRVHPDWKPYHRKYDADISILVLSEHVLFTNYIRHVCLPADDTARIDGANGYIVGWGLEKNGLKSHLEFPKSAISMHINDSFCYTADQGAGLISSVRTFCGRGEEQSPNRGDSGGGFFVLSSFAWVQHGIISAIQGNRSGDVDPNSIAIYTNVNWFKSWIQETLTQSGGSAVMTVNESIKINLTCDYRINSVGTYVCEIHGLDTRSDNLEVDSFIGTHLYNKTDDDVKQIEFSTDTMLFLPDGVGNFFKNLNTLEFHLRTKHITRSNLNNLRNLVELIFDTNDIETFEEDILCDLPNLEFFDLTHNSLKVINEKTFEKNTKLRKVDLSSNQLELLPRNLFQNNLLLEYFFSHANKIKEIDESTFEKNINLRTVDLSENQLELLPRNLFQNNLLLRSVDLGFNSLKNIEINFAEFKNLIVIELPGNVCISEYFYKSSNLNLRLFKPAIRDMSTFQTMINNRCTSRRIISTV